ncbi:MAG: hypothetical protein VX252_17515 [Myxococcota bacterium]|nr:hypothetical protein [Myxococcota bacterium]
MRERLLFLLLSLMFLIPSGLVAVPEADACSCLPPDLARSYHANDEVVEVKVLRHRSRGGPRGKRHRRGARDWVYSARVKEVYKGCRRSGSIVKIVTPRSGAQCGVTWLKPGKTYLLSGESVSRGRLRIAACDYNVEVSGLSDEDRAFLDTRYNCCGGSCECVNSDPVSCFADPCSVAAPCEEAVECVSQYCGECRAEFYDEGGSQVCVEESCSLDTDCRESQWCRPSEEVGRNICVSYQQEGESCGGFTPDWGQERCEPALVCTDFVAAIPDMPGRCREGCEDDLGCADSEYCSEANDVCRPDGSCFTDQDCEAPGNGYIHPACVGYGVCGSQGQCGWQCGDAACRDLAQPVLSGSFGFCRMILGFGVVDGECVSVSGCDNQGYLLQDSMADCQAKCGAEPSL